MSDVTEILSAIDRGDSKAAEELLPLVYEELRRLAASKMDREKAGQSLQPTVLVHEAYLRLVGGDAPQRWNGRAHFFGAAAEAMRRILIESARHKRSGKHGGHLQRVDLEIADPGVADREELFAVHEALDQFEERWPEKAKFVKLRYFVGLTIPEASKAIGVSRATGERYWTFARAWLHSRLRPDR